MDALIVSKFGGSSVASADRIRGVVSIVGDALEREPGRHIVVVSALGGVTDQLIAAIDAALAPQPDARKHRAMLAALQQRHEDTLRALVEQEAFTVVMARLEPVWNTLRELLDGIALLHECSPRTRDAVIGSGERLSAPIIAAAFRSAGYPAEDWDATRFIRTNAAHGEATVDFDETRSRVAATLGQADPNTIAVVTGFIAATPGGALATLGRSGSDYTATILGGVMGAARVDIWTDVDGVLSTDPRIEPKAFSLPQLSYREAGEMAYFGAKVLHPRTMRPLIEAGIPLRIKNTMRPQHEGTLISHQTDTTPGQVRAVSTIRDVSVIMLEGSGMVGVPGIAARVFSALAQVDINVLMISQASSEQSICTVVHKDDTEVAVEQVRRAFQVELSRQDANTVYAIRDAAVVSIVGDQMRHFPGLAGAMFSALGDSRINVLAIAQGASETNISAVVSAQQASSAVKVLHRRFAERVKRVHVVLAGVGGVGQALYEQLHAAQGRLREVGLDVIVAALCNRDRYVVFPDGATGAHARSLVQLEGQPGGVLDVLSALQALGASSIVLADCSASDAVTAAYQPYLEAGARVVTANKRAGSGPLAYYQALKRIGHDRWRYESTVGAGLPIMATLEDLVRTGDRVRSVEGILSGTLAFLITKLESGSRFSEAVQEARALGYTEPDPRDDLSGEDVARKLLIMAREVGFMRSRDELSVESLVPSWAHALDVDGFMDRLTELDEVWARRMQEASDEGKVLRFVGRIDAQEATVGLQAYAPDHPLASVQGTGNCVTIFSDRYASLPLVIQGHGAGTDVTAAGVFADLLRLVQS